MRIIVTGGAGFIGSHCVEALLSERHEVVVYDALTTGRLDNLPLQAPGLSVVVGDIRQPRVLRQAMTETQPHAVIHLAAAVSAPLSFTKPLYYNAVNIDGTLAVLEAARAANVPKVVLASSAAVYGDSANLPLDEDTIPHPQSPYALHKVVAEEYGRLYARDDAMSIVALRFFNVYGPRQDPSSSYSGVISRFVDAALNNAPIVVHGTGKQTRDFVYVSDVAQALVAAATQSQQGYSCCNVGRGSEISLLELITAIEFITGAPIQVAFSTARRGDIHRSYADITRLNQVLKVTPTVDLDAGLRSLMAWRSS